MSRTDSNDSSYSGALKQQQSSSAAEAHRKASEKLALLQFEQSTLEREKRAELAKQEATLKIQQAELAAREAALAKQNEELKIEKAKLAAREAALATNEKQPGTRGTNTLFSSIPRPPALPGQTSTQVRRTCAGPKTAEDENTILNQRFF